MRALKSGSMPCHRRIRRSQEGPRDVILSAAKNLSEVSDMKYVMPKERSFTSFRMTERNTFLEIAHSRSHKGFTLVELLAALAFLAIVIPTMMRALTIANRAGVVAERKVDAAHLADCLLTEMVLTDEWRDGEEEGDFGEEWPGYEWTLEEESWEVATMRRLTLVVSFTVQDREYSVKLSTLAKESQEQAGA